MATNISLPNVRTQIAAIRGSKDQIEQSKYKPQKDAAHQTAEALTVIQNALDLLVNKLNSTNATVEEAAPITDDQIFELYDGTQI